MATEIKGIDVSKHQTAGRVNFSALKSHGYEFCMMRAGYGMYDCQKDRAFESHYKAAVNAGINVGAYHYSYATSVKEAEREAECFLGWIKGKQLRYPVAFDIEDRSQKYLSNRLRTDIALAWMSKVEAAGYYTMLYSSASWLGSKLDMSRLKHFDVWCAAYVDKDKISRYYKGSFGMWQYSSSGKLSGVYPNRLDLDLAFKDYAKIICRAGLNNL